MGTMTTTESGSAQKVESRAGYEPARPWSSHRMTSSTSGLKKTNERSTDTEYVVRSEIDNGMPANSYDAMDVAWARADGLNEEPGLPDDHTVHEEEPL